MSVAGCPLWSLMPALAKAEPIKLTHSDGMLAQKLLHASLHAQPAAWVAELHEFSPPWFLSIHSPHSCADARAAAAAGMRAGGAREWVCGRAGC